MRYVLVALIAGAFIVLQLLIGGTRLAFSLPAYGLLALAAVLSLFSARKAEIPTAGCLVGTLLFFAYVIIRQVTSPVEYLARNDLLLVIACLLVYLLVSFQLTASKYRAWLIAILLGMAAVHTGVAVLQFFTGREITFFNFIEPVEYGTRATGLYICPNHLAGFLEVIVLFGLAIVLWSRRPLWMKLLAGYVVLMSIGGLVLTASRGGYISLAVGLLVFAVLSLAALRKARPERFWPATTAITIMGILAVGLMAVFFLNQPSLHRRSLTVPEDFQARFSLWQAAVRQFEVNPVIGTGSGTYHYYGQKFRDPAVATYAEYAHNDYLQFLAEFGIIGTILLLIFLGAHLRAGWQSVALLAGERRHSTQQLCSDRLALTIGALSAVAAFLVHSAIDFNLHIPANALLIAFAFGVLAHPGITQDSVQTKLTPVLPIARFALPALAIWMATIGLRTWPAEWYGEMARVAFREQKFTNTIHFAEKALAWDKTNPFLWLYLGQAHAEIANTSQGVTQTNSWQAAVDAFSRGLPLFPQERWLLLGLGEALDALGRFSEAEHCFQTALHWDPASAEIRALYGIHLRTAGRRSDAEEQFKKSLALRYTWAAANGLQTLAEQKQ